MNNTTSHPGTFHIGSFRAALVASLLVASPAAALAAPAPHNAAAETIYVTPVDTSVHDRNGQRFDVPSSLLRPDGRLINGLPPQPQQFD